MTRFKYYSNYLACLLGTLIAFELCWIGAKYVIEGEVVHTCLDHFIADLECRTSNRGAYRRINVTRVAAIDTMHRLDRLAGDVPHRTPPTGMRSPHHPAARVIEQERDAVGRRYGHAHAGQCRDQPVGL